MVKLSEGGGKKKPPPKVVEEKKKTKPYDKALEAANKIRNEAERAAYLIRALDEVDKPAKLVEAIVDHLWSSDRPANESAQKMVELAEKRKTDPAFLDAVAWSLDNWHREDEAFEVLRMAIAAGSKHKRSLEMLGRAYLSRGDVGGVPLLERVIAREPDWIPPRVSLAVWFCDKEPARALALLEGRDSGNAHEVRAMALEAQGKTREAELAVRESLALFDNDIEGRKDLAEWHYTENRYPRALVHAKALFEMRKKPGRRFGYVDVDAIDETIVKCYRVGGGFEEIIPWLVERADTMGLEPDLAWHAFYALTAFHPTRELALALRCAEVVSKRDEEQNDLHEVRAWKVRVAAQKQRAGEPGLLEALAQTGLDNDAVAWVELADAYYAIDQFAAAHAAVDRALQLDPKSTGALSTLFNLALANGDEAGLHRAAEAMLAAEPYWHQGPEHLGRSFARQGIADAATTNARRGMQIAPYCQNAWCAVAEAAIVAGDDARAKDALARSLAIEAAEVGDDVSIVQAALSGDAAALDAALHARYKHLAEPPFPKFVAALRAAQSRATST